MPDSSKDNEMSIPAVLAREETRQYELAKLHMAGYAATSVALAAYIGLGKIPDGTVLKIAVSLLIITVFSTGYGCLALLNKIVAKIDLLERERDGLQSAPLGMRLENKNVADLEKSISRHWRVMFSMNYPITALALIALFFAMYPQADFPMAAAPPAVSAR